LRHLYYSSWSQLWLLISTVDVSWLTSAKKCAMMTQVCLSLMFSVG